MSEDYSEFTTEELVAMYHEAKKQSAIFNVSQNVKKVLLKLGALAGNS